MSHYLVSSRAVQPWTAVQCNPGQVALQVALDTYANLAQPGGLVWVCCRLCVQSPDQK